MNRRCGSWCGRGRGGARAGAGRRRGRRCRLGQWRALELSASHLQASIQASSKITVRCGQRLGPCPVSHSSCSVLAFERCRSGQGQGFEVDRVDGQGPLDQPGGFASSALTLQNSQHVGMVGQQLGIARRQLSGAQVGLISLCKTLHGGIGACQHFPGLRVRRLPRRRVFQALCQLRHHGLDLRLADRVALGHAMRHDRLWVSNPTVEPKRQHRHCQAQQHRGDGGSADSGRHLYGCFFVQGPTLQFAAGL